MSEEKIPEAFFDKYPYPAVRENFSRIWKWIEQQWGAQECTDYLESLVLVEDGRDRRGFDAAVLSELMLLGLLHEQAHPEYSTHPAQNE